MGQQQLLLLLITVVLVAIATLAAFEMLNRHYRQDEADGVLDRTLAIASHAVQWRTLNAQFGGANGSYERLETNGLQMLGLEDANIRGRYFISRATATQLEVTGLSGRYPGIGARVYVTGDRVDSSRVVFQSQFGTY